MNIRLSNKTICRNAHYATSFWSRFSGLQLRLRWPKDCDGILFPRCRAVHTFFTFLRPDILFLNKRGRVVTVHPSTLPWLVLAGPKGAKETLELPSGTIRRMRLKVGSVLKTA